MITILTVALVALFSLSSPSTAQEAEPKQETAEEQQEEEGPPRVYWDNGLWFRARRANFMLKIGGQAQNDKRSAIDIDIDVPAVRLQLLDLESVLDFKALKYERRFDPRSIEHDHIHALREFCGVNSDSF